MTILLVSDSDRGALACRLLAERLERAGQSCLTVGQGCSDGWESPLPPETPLIPMGLMDLVGTELLRNAKAVGVFVECSDALKRFATAHRALAESQGHRAAPIFSGPLKASLGDELMQQLSERLCCDLLLLPGERQCQEVKAMTRFWPAAIAAPHVLAMGLWFMPERPPRGCLNAGSPKPPHTLLALVQETVPTQPGGKAQLLRQLISWAEASPQWSVVVHHDEAWPSGQPWTSKMCSSEWVFPQNLVFGAQGQLLTQLATCSACLTVSSAWSLTAMAWGRPTLVIGDYGIHTDQGTTSMFGCGAMHRLQSIRALDQLLELPRPDQAWLGSMGWGIPDGALRLAQALESSP